MPSTYSNATQEIAPIAEPLIAKFHQDLVDANVTIDFIFATAGINEDTGEQTGPAIVHNGYRALGLTKIMSLKDRTMGRADAEILLDGDVWVGMSADQCNALLDHELEHIEVKRDKVGAIVTDDLNRPKLTLKKHDFQAGWFHSIAERWQVSSQEIMQLMGLMRESDIYSQYTKPGLHSSIFEAAAKAQFGEKAKVTIEPGQPVRIEINADDIEDNNQGSLPL